MGEWCPTLFTHDLLSRIEIEGWPEFDFVEWLATWAFFCMAGFFSSAPAAILISLLLFGVPFQFLAPAVILS